MLDLPRSYGRRLLRLHQHPAFGGWDSGGRDHSLGRLVEANGYFGSATWIRQDRSGPCGWGQIVAGAAFITAPSMTTPAVVYRPMAMRSLRARATMIVLRIRPPSRTRSWNHRLKGRSSSHLDPGQDNVACRVNHNFPICRSVPLFVEFPNDAPPILTPLRC